MRELGGDQLEAYGGVAAMPLPFEGTLPSELADAGIMRAVTVATSADNRTVGPITFPDVRCAHARVPGRLGSVLSSSSRNVCVCGGGGAVPAQMELQPRVLWVDGEPVAGVGTR
jgi:hypothetical protein